MKNSSPGQTFHGPDPESASLDELREYFKAEHQVVRADAACAIGDRLRTKELTALEPPLQEELAALLKDDDFLVRLEAAIALAEVHDSRATEILLNAMRLKRFRLDAIRALGVSTDKKAIEPLRAFMRKFFLPWADKLQAAAALCTLGDPDGANYLEARINTRRFLERAASVYFIGDAHHPRAKELLLGIAQDPQHDARDAAIRGLGALGDKSIANKLDSLRNEVPKEFHQDIDVALALLEK
ncbi:HEAT repeat domain-containing protein [Myxococcota bacterium]|nr:HEAT repeat domain-containing protein [Myxococcota bacterium]